MTTFTSFTLPASLQHVAALDAVATDCCGVVSHSSGYTLTDPVFNIEDWGFRWINTGGTGNNGTLVLVPLSTRTRKLAFAGKAKYLTESTGTDTSTGELLASVAVGYKFEASVLEVVRYLLSDDAWQYACEVSHKSVWSAREVKDLAVPTDIKDKLLALSASRRETVKALVETVVKQVYTLV